MTTTAKSYRELIQEEAERRAKKIAWFLKPKHYETDTEKNLCNHFNLMGLWASGPSPSWASHRIKLRQTRLKEWRI